MCADINTGRVTPRPPGVAQSVSGTTSARDGGEIDERTGSAGAPFRFASPNTKRRMLVIVNPYASTVSDRLRHLVVYALQGRFEVDAVDTRGARARDRDLPRGRTRGLRRGGCLRRRRHGERSREWAASASPTPSPACPAAPPTSFWQACSASRGTRSTPPSTCSRLADDWRPRKVDLGVVNGRLLHVRLRPRPRRERGRARVDANLRLKSRFGPWLLHVGGAQHASTRRYLRPPAAPDGPHRATARSSRASRAIVQNGDSVHVLPEPPDRQYRRRRLARQSGTLAGGVLRPRDPDDRHASIAFRALAATARVTRNCRITGHCEDASEHRLVTQRR